MARAPAVNPSASAGERWVSFLRGYGPVNRTDGMFAESLPAFARAHGVEPLRFDHPSAEAVRGAVNPQSGRLTNVILTGTAGDGKTTLCIDLWTELGGGDARGRGDDRSDYGVLDVETVNGQRRVHFIFEFTGWAPQSGQPWSEDQLDLLDRFAASTGQDDPAEVFVIAANDGKLVQAWDTLKTGAAAALKPVIETLLAEDRVAFEDLNLLLLNLSRLRTEKVMRAAIDCLLARPEWRCLEDEAMDPAFSPASPLAKNLALLKTPAVRERLLALADLVDCNGLHIPIREVLLLLVNALLGSRSPTVDRLMTAEDLRRQTEAEDVHSASLYGNLFGANLSERAREQYAVFRNLGAFRIGFETSNALDSLLVFGRDDDALKARHAATLDADPSYAQPPEFERLRRDYLEADEERQEGVSPFMNALVGERQRLFFLLPDATGAEFSPWSLTVFHHAGDYRRSVLAPLRANGAVELRIVKKLVQGLNRVWTGMMAGDLDKLYLSTGLDLTTAPISDIHLSSVEIRRTRHHEEVTIFWSEAQDMPLLRVSLGADNHVDFPLLLTRFEFLLRVAEGALPSSFSKECSEDVLAFKSQVLSRFYQDARPEGFTLLSPLTGGRLDQRTLGVTG